MRDVSLAILAQISSVGINHRSGVVKHTGHLLFVDRNDHRHLVFARYAAHQLSGWSIGYAFDKIVPVRVLLGRKVWSIEELLEANDLHALLRRVIDHRNVLIDHGLLDLLQWAFGWFFIGGLYQSAFHYS